MIETSNDWVREDELDLGQEDDDHSPPTRNGISDHASSQEPSRHDSMAYFEEDIPALVSENHVSGKLIPPVDAGSTDLPSSPRSGQPGAPGSVDETLSTPDDTPSLHVGCDRVPFVLTPADENRALFCRREAAARWPSGALPTPVRVLPIAHSTVASSPDYPPLRRLVSDHHRRF